MAIAVFGDVPGGTAEQDASIQERVGVVANPPPGIVLRMAGATARGWRVVTVWESQEQWEAFRRDRLEPAFKEMGWRPSFQVWPLDSLRIVGAR